MKICNTNSNQSSEFQRKPHCLKADNILNISAFHSSWNWNFAFNKAKLGFSWAWTHYQVTIAAPETTLSSLCVWALRERWRKKSKFGYRWKKGWIFFSFQMHLFSQCAYKSLLLLIVTAKNKPLWKWILWSCNKKAGEREEKKEKNFKSKPCLNINNMVYTDFKILTNILV